MSLLCASLAWLTEKIAEEEEEQSPKIIDDENISHLISEDESAGDIDLNISNDTEIEDSFQLGGDNSKEAVPQIRYKVIYASRTHKQLAQVMGEFKKTVYKDLLSVCLASRENYCINEKVKKEKKLSEINAACKEIKKNCKYYNQKSIDSLAKGIRNLRLEYEQNGVIDIEDLVNIGHGRRVCPYFTSQSIAFHSARVIFAPYNYLLEQLVNLQLKDAVVIFDEGHNIESACEDAASGFLTSTALSQMGLGLIEILDAVDIGIIDLATKYGLDRDTIQELSSFCQKVYETFNHYFIASKRSDQHTKNISISEFVNILFNQLEVTPSKAKQYASIFEGLFELLKDIHIDLLKGQGGKAAFSKGLETIGDFFSRIYSSESSYMSPDEFIQFLHMNFRVAITEMKVDTASNGRRRKSFNPNFNSWVLNFYCMNPGVTINRLVKKGIRSIIITSGTLAPMDSFEAEMGIKFPRTLCNPHVIPESQLVIFMICKHEDQILDGSFKSESPAYFNAVGRAVERYISKIPAGVLLFFKSYSAKQRCFEEWQKSGLLYNINVYKEIFHEPQDKEEFADALASYKETIDHGKGGIFAAVYRGKVSEGLDLANDYCRGAIIIGLPYPYLKDPKVYLKRDYLTTSKVSLTSDKWYENQMLRAVNQAVGRIVRHKDDYGIVLLLDTKYENKKSGLSQWLHKFVRDTRECKSHRFDSFFQENAKRQKSLQDPPAIQEQLHQQHNDHEPIANENSPQLQSSVTGNTDANTTTNSTTSATSTAPTVSLAPAVTSMKRESQDEQELLSYDFDFDEGPGPSDPQPCNKKMRIEDTINAADSALRPPSSQASQTSEYEFDDSLDNIFFNDIPVNSNSNCNGTCRAVDTIEGMEENFNLAYDEVKRQDFTLLNNAISVYKNGGGLDNLVHFFKQTFGRHGHEQLKRVVYNLARYIPFASEKDASLFKVKCVGDE